MNMNKGMFVGLSGLDMVYSIKELPNENTKTKTSTYEIFVGGPAANAAITFSLLGGKAKLATCIGDSEYGKMIKRELIEDYDIEVIDFIKGSTCIPCISSIVINPDNGNRTIWSGQQTVEQLRNIDLNDLFENILFCLSDCNAPQIAVPLLKGARERATAVVLDAGSWKQEMPLYLSLSTDVIASAVCSVPEEYGGLFAASESRGVDNIAVTNGEKGILWRNPAGNGLISPPEVKITDTLGAGDVFHGAYCYYRYVMQLNFADALKSASEVSASSVQYFGPRRGVREFVKSGI
jgi:sugar/nucleoside kinase (ribokinase family)